MMHLFRLYVIGGDSGKRELSLFAFLIWLGACVWIAVNESAGVQLPTTLSLVQFTGPFVFGWIALAFGFEWATKQAGLRLGQSEAVE